MNDVDKLLYEKANIYLLHSDNLRWALLGGYVALFGPVMLQIKDNIVIPNLPSAILFGAAYVISALYMVVLAFQSWQYNLISAYIADCEKKLVKKQRLMLFAEFTKAARGHVTPLHPSFTFAAGVISVISLAFLLPAMSYMLFDFKINIKQNIHWLFMYAILFLILYIVGFYFIFKNFSLFMFVKDLVQPRKGKLY